MRIVLTNNYHNTETALNIKPAGNCYKVSRRQAKKAKNALCCAGCVCSDTFGCRPLQLQVRRENYDGSYLVEVVC